MNTERHWQKLYQIAVLETDWTKMEERVGAVDSAIERRLSELSLKHSGGSEENLAIVATLQRLDVLRGDVAR